MYTQDVHTCTTAVHALKLESALQGHGSSCVAFTLNTGNTNTGLGESAKGAMKEKEDDLQVC